MAGSDTHSTNDDYFNDLSRQPPEQNEGQDEHRRDSQDQLPKPKRIACVLCRKRKLKCDGIKPSCGTCTRLQHDCSYDEVRRKSGPKRGYVKALEARLAQVETLLKTQDDQPSGGKKSGGQTQSAAALLNDDVARQDFQMNGGSMLLPHTDQITNAREPPAEAQFPQAALSNEFGDGELPGEDNFPWEMIGLGLDEPLPTQDVIDELDQGYFEKIHPSVPVIHRPRYFAAMNLAPHMRPPVCLRYAMWANAAAVMNKYEGIHEHFYSRARKYIQQDEMRGHGESMITVAHAQTWTLLATYEFKSMFFPRAWMSSGRASRLAQMMGLHRLDGTGLDVKQCLPPPRDWTEREERRRTFWMCFCVDRYSSIGTGWPMSIEEKDIRTNLPGDEESYETSKPSKTMTLDEALEPQGAPKLSSFAGVILMACLFGKNLLHLHRPSPNDKDDDLNGDFWKRHRHIDSMLLNTALALPDDLRMPSGLNNANIVFMNMNIHTSTICLHQAAIFKADKNRMPARISAESKVRCITAAAEIATIMRQISHVDMAGMHPFIAFCLYVAARVFVQYMRSRPGDTQIKASLQFLLSAMHAIKRRNPLTESFLVQLDVDLEAAGLEDSRALRDQIVLQPEARVQAEGCPMSQIGLRPLNEDGHGVSQYTAPDRGLHSKKTRPTYGDGGLGKYGNPNQNANVMPDLASNPHQSNNLEMSDYIMQTPQFDLPRRQKTPGSTVESVSGTHKSPHSGEGMDMSPDNNSSNTGHTPGSSTQSGLQNLSSNTSTNGFSPSNQQQASRATEQTLWANDFGTMSNNPRDFVNADEYIGTEFNLHDFPSSMPAQPASGNGFVMPTQQDTTGFGSTSHTGMTPSGFTPGPSDGMYGNDNMMGLSEADWNLVMHGFDDWNTGVQPPPDMSSPWTRS